MTWPDIYRRMLILALAEWAAFSKDLAEETWLRRREH